jgi:hypothetical protein
MFPEDSLNYLNSVSKQVFEERKSRAVVIFAGTDTGAARAQIFGIVKFKNP